MIKATLEGAPEGLGVRLAAFAYPSTVEQFEAIIEAAGGRDAFHRGYGGDSVKTDIGDATLTVNAPSDERAKVVKPQNEFIRKFLDDGAGDPS